MERSSGGKKRKKKKVGRGRSFCLTRHQYVDKYETATTKPEGRKVEWVEGLRWGGVCRSILYDTMLYRESEKGGGGT